MLENNQISISSNKKGIKQREREKMELYSFYILKKIHLTFFCAEFTKITELLRMIRTVYYNINLPLSIV